MFGPHLPSMPRPSTPVRPRGFRGKPSLTPYCPSKLMRDILAFLSKSLKVIRPVLRSMGLKMKSQHMELLVRMLE